MNYHNDQHGKITLRAQEGMLTLTVTSIFLVTLKTLSLGGNHVCYLKPIQLPKDSEAMILGEECK